MTRSSMSKEGKIYISAILVAITVFILFFSFNTGIFAISEDNEQIKVQLHYLEPKSKGIVSTKEVIGIGVERQVFKRDLDENNLCTKWEVFSLETFSSTQICYGSQECCNFVQLEPSRESWNDPFYLSYGKHGATYQNTVTAQVIYFDVSIEEDNPHSEIHLSNAESVEAKFVDKKDRKVSVKDRFGKEIGQSKITDQDDGNSDIEIGKDINKIKLRGIKNLEQLEVIIDKGNDEKLHTDVVHIENNPDMESAVITLEKRGEINAILYCQDNDFDKNTLNCLNWQKTGISFIDNGDTVTFTVSHFSAYAGANITIIDLKSLPKVGNNWTVRFNTTGNADLIITAINGTTFGSSAPDDIEFSELKCGNEVLMPVFNGISVIYHNFSCAETAYHLVKVHTSGSHYQEFRFGDDVGYAENYAFGKCNGSEPPESPAENNNWIIGNVTLCTDTDIQVIGNITINGTGKLTLQNVTLNISCPSNGRCGINVSNESLGMFVFNSTIKSNGTANYTFKVFAPFEVKNSIITDVGIGSGTVFAERGLFLGYPSVIRDTIINHSNIGIALGANYTNITNTNLSNITIYGIIEEDGMNVIGTRLENSILTLIGDNSADSSAITLLTGNSNITLVGTKINRSSRGIFDSRSSALIINSTIENNTFSDIRVDDGVIVILNSSIPRNRTVWSTTTLGNITFKWYLIVNVTDKSGVQLNNVNLSVYRNDTNAIEWTKLTNTNGTTNTVETTEGIARKDYNTTTDINAINISFDPHNVTASFSGYKTDFIISNITSSKVILIILDQFPLVTALNFPIDNANISNSSVSFNFTATDDLNASNCTLHINQTGQWNAAKTELTIRNGTVNTINLTNLTNGTYLWSIECIDNSSSSDFFSQNYTLTIDTVPSNITNVTNSSITHNSVIITWNTGELTNSSVRFGGQDQLTSTATDTAFVTSHSITLGLSPETQYFYNVTSCDPSGNCVMNGTFNFTTSSAPSTTPEDKDKGSGGSPGAGPGDGKEKGETPESPKLSPPEEESSAEATTRAWSLSGISDIKEFCDTANRSIEYINRFCQKYHESKDFIEINRTFEYDPIKNQTLVNLTIIPEAELVNFSYYESIPKCIALLIKEGLLEEIPVKFKNMDFDIVEEDPLIVWHFTEVREPIDLSYVVDKELLKNCTDLLAGFGIAELIKPFEGPEDVTRLEPPEKKSFFGMIWGFMKSPLGGAVLTIIIISTALIIVGFGYRIEVSREAIFKKPRIDLLKTVQDYFRKIYVYEAYKKQPEKHGLIRKKERISERPKHAGLAAIISEAVKITAIKIKLPHISINIHAGIEKLKRDAIKGLEELQAKKNYLKNRIKVIGKEKRKAFAKVSIFAEDSAIKEKNKKSIMPESKELPSLPPPPEYAKVKRHAKISKKQARSLNDIVAREFIGTPLEHYEEASKELIYWVKHSIDIGRGYKEISRIAESSGWDSEDIKKAYDIAASV